MKKSRFFTAAKMTTSIALLMVAVFTTSCADQKIVADYKNVPSEKNISGHALQMLFEQLPEYVEADTVHVIEEVLQGNSAKLNFFSENGSITFSNFDGAFADSEWFKDTTNSEDQCLINAVLNNKIANELGASGRGNMSTMHYVFVKKGNNYRLLNYSVLSSHAVNWCATSWVE